MAGTTADAPEQETKESTEEHRAREGRSGSRSGRTGEGAAGSGADIEDAEGQTVEDVTTDIDTPLYEYWKIGYLTSTIDSNGLVLDNNFNLNYGTYIYLDADGNIYDAATFKGNVATRDDVTIEVDPDAVDSNIDTSILTDEELSGISSFKIEETLLSHAESEYFIVGWAYGSTARPEFEYAFISGVAGDEYTITYHADKGPIKDTYKLTSGITGFNKGLEEFVDNMINSVVGTVPSITEPVLNFKKVKKKKISSKDLSTFKQLESGVAAGTSTAASTTTTTTGY